MDTETITIKVSAEVAQAYRLAPPESREKLSRFLDNWSREAVPEDPEVVRKRLRRTMAEAGRMAQANGMTKEILEDILETNLDRVYE